MSENSPALVYRLHAVQRMIERGISDGDVRQVLASGKEVEDYSLAQPYPSRLLPGWSGARPIHVVVADNKSDNEAIIVTVYEPDLNRWERGFERRKLQ